MVSFFGGKKSASGHSFHTSKICKLLKEVMQCWWASSHLVGKLRSTARPTCLEAHPSSGNDMPSYSRLTSWEGSTICCILTEVKHFYCRATQTFSTCTGRSFRYSSSLTNWSNDTVFDAFWDFLFYYIKKNNPIYLHAGHSPVNWFDGPLVGFKSQYKKFLDLSQDLIFSDSFITTCCENKVVMKKRKGQVSVSALGATVLQAALGEPACARTGGGCGLAWGSPAPAGQQEASSGAQPWRVLEGNRSS